jgi:hypothetical protein
MSLCERRRQCSALPRHSAHAPSLGLTIMVAGPVSQVCGPRPAAFPFDCDTIWGARTQYSRDGPPAGW